MAESNQPQTRRTRVARYMLLAAGVWTVIVVGLWLWSAHTKRQNTREIAQAQARTHFNKDQAFRFWAAARGGLYVAVDERTPPNPHLAHIPERDITSPSGIDLTLMNPAWVIRQLNEDYAKLYGVTGRITSLKPLRPENGPDEWEQKALLSFEQGVSEVNECVEIDGEPYLRLMRPMRTRQTRQSCLKCHGHQGYQVGDVRGGVGVSVPMGPLLAQERAELTTLLVSFACLWLLGLGGIGLGGRQIHRRIRQYDEAVQATKQFLQTVIDALPEDMLVVDRDYQVVLTNRGSADLVGVDVAEGDHPKCHQLLYNRDAPCTEAGHSCVVKRVIATKKPVTTSHDYIGPSGRRTPVEVVAAPIFDESGEVVQVIEVFRDLTERRRAEEKLARLSAIVQSSDDAIFSESLDGTITSWNQGAALLFGYNETKAIGRPTSMLVPSRFSDEYQAALEKARRGHRTEQLDTQRLCSDGKLIDVSVNLSPIKDAAGIVIGVSTIARDITDRKQAEEELLDYAEALKTANSSLEEFTQVAETANRSKSEFLANMSHEIRTPLTAILGFTDVLLGEEDWKSPSSDRAGALQTIRRNGHYLLELINDILDLSKIEAGKLEVERIPCSPVKILSGVSSLMRVRAEAKNLSLRVEYSGAIPETIQTDPVRLRQILINLVGNAVRFTEIGEIRLRAQLLDGQTLDDESESSRIQFDVIDTGIGLTEEQLDRLFRPFTQADSSTTRKFGGTGLGLTISKRLAQMLGGDIQVNSDAGKGSTFSVVIEAGSLDGVPMLENPAESLIEHKSDTTNAAHLAELNFGCRILLVEDGPDNQRLIAFVLKKAGAEVEVAENGLVGCEMALAARAQGNPFDVILMDIQMPVMDGYEATERLRQEGYAGSIIALTANTMAGDREKCLAAGCNDFASKPIDRPSLLAIVADHARATTEPVANDSGQPEESQQAESG